MVSELKDDIVAEGPDFTALKNYVANNIYRGSSYSMVNYNDDTTEIVFKQKYDNKRFVEGDDAKLVFYCEDGYVKSYTQTMLTDITKLSGTNDLISPSQGFESLFQNNKIPSKADLVDIQLGYYILGNLESSNVYMPVWYYTIEVDDQRMQLMVDAIEGQVLTTEMSQKVEYTAQS
ncbi:hypothetical protein BTHER_05560 [Brochothrix thermosphacta DSM 20171 = FSL F6-1036]|nr:hypothetical protein BTHER_05560 [Brochothrix thermosphacta DSM 20171 = FSL F6-1036]